MARLVDSIIGHQSTWQSWFKQKTSGHLPHALALAGPSGIGKKRVAWAMSQTLLCTGDPPPCGECAPCLRVERQQSEGVLFIEPEKGIIKLEAVEKILHFLNLQRISRARVVLIDGAQNLNLQAANSLLKALEEPPEQTYFFLIVNDWNQLLPTIRSRTQVMRLIPLTPDQLPAVEGEPEWIRRAARGSFTELENLRGNQSSELRPLALNFLTGALLGQRTAIHQWLDQTKDRGVALEALHFLQQLLRDWALVETGEIIHRDLATDLKALSPVPLEGRVELWSKAHQLERDLIAHVDRALIFENFFFQAREIGR